MADDDIDIEEHDVLDNPVVRRIFPDLSILKKEIIDFNDETPVKDESFKSGESVQQDEKDQTLNGDNILTLPSFLLRPRDEKIATTKSHNNMCTTHIVKEACKNNINLCDKIPAQEQAINEELNASNTMIETRVATTHGNIISSASIEKKLLTNNVNKVKRDETDTKSPSQFPIVFKKSNAILETKTKYHKSPREKPSNVINLKKENSSNTTVTSISNFQPIKRHLIERTIETEQMNIEEKKSLLPWNSNKTILGPKPCVEQAAGNTCTKGCKKLNSSRNLNVSLENLATFLSKSNRYCENCLILFPSIKTLNDHRNRIHTEVSNVQSSRIIRLAVSKTDRHQCDLCDKVFFSLSYLIRHKRIIHSINTNVRKKERLNLKHHIQRPSPNKSNIITRKFKCTHCNYSFKSQQNLIDHMYKVLYLKIKEEKKPVEKIKYKYFDKDRYIKIPDLYRCPLCSCYFKTQVLFEYHVSVKHKITAADLKLEKVSFESICKYCSHEYSSINAFNAHIRKFHQKEFKIRKTLTKSKHTNINKHKCQEVDLNKNRSQCISNSVIKDVKKNNYFLKSALFKCIKCDVCFLNGSRAGAHNEHMDMLVNWKCLKCMNIFKKEDELLHTQQHLLTSTFDLFEISEITKSFLLYRCPNCTTYFREKDLFNHYSLCELQTPNSEYCKICHILVDNAIKEAHDIQHKQVGDKELNNILVDSDVVICNEENKNSCAEDFDSITDLEGKLCRQTEKSAKAENGTNVSTEKSMNTEFPQTNGFLQLNKVGERAIKKMLSFVYCNSCQCFVSRVHKLYNHTRTNCSHFVKIVCKHCGLLFSNKLINRHRKLHQDWPGLTLNDFKFYDLKSGKTIWPPIPKYPKCRKCEKRFVTKTAIISHNCGEDYKTCHICKIKFSKSAFTLHMSFHNYLPNNNKIRRTANDLNCLDFESTKSKVPTCTTLKSSLESNKPHQNNLLLVYICKICKVALDVYDKVIEHCHEHFSSVDKEPSTRPCESCNLIFDVACFNNHRMLHAYNKNKNFTALSFDIFYATAENTIWLNHLFGSLPAEEINKIIGNSIYNFERRLKMKIFQDGLTCLTLYKCAKCNCYIDSKSLFKHCHIDILCYEAKAVQCSFCGIHLASDNFRIEHEKIHLGQNVTLKSYRIVLFNCNEDKTINNALSLPSQYILYQCRNCNGVVDKMHFLNHKCDFEDVAKCSHCGLLIYNKDYMSHVLKHKEFDSFRENNIRIILIGQLNSVADFKGRAVSSFKGMISDYLFYQCAKCKVNFNETQSSTTHKCLRVAEVTKCLKCELYFEDSQLKNHTKFHEHDQYFSVENMTIVKFGFDVITPSDSNVIVIEDEEDFNSKNDNNKISELVLEKHDDIFKCICGLHFLNESSAVSHYEKCNNSRSAKQICPKCGLVFKSSILYQHLLTHHGSKVISYKFNIIEISQTHKL